MCKVLKNTNETVKNLHGIDKSCTFAKNKTKKTILRYYLTDASCVSTMELRQLRMFVLASESKSFSEAAKKACVTQSTLSLNIKQLEGEINAPLFDRNSQGVKLTELGEETLIYAKKTIALETEMREHINDIIQTKSGSLRIGATNAFIPLLIRVIVEFSKQYPQVKLTLIQKTAVELRSMLLAREIDCAVGYKIDDTYDNIDHVSLLKNRLTIIVNANHPLSKYKTVRLKDITKYHFALPTNTIMARRTLDKILEQQGISLDVKVEMNMAIPLISIARRTSLVAVLTSTSASGLPYSDLKAIPIVDEGGELHGCFHTLNDVYRKKSVDEFLKMLKEQIKLCEMQ